MFLFLFMGVELVPCSNIICYWGSFVGYQQGKLTYVDKKWVCGSPLSRDYLSLALQPIIMR